MARSGSAGADPRVASEIGGAEVEGGVMSLSNLFDAADPEVRALLDRCLEGADLPLAGALRLSAVNGRELHALLATADELRRRPAGDQVSYVLNPNLHFTHLSPNPSPFSPFSR